MLHDTKVRGCDNRHGEKITEGGLKEWSLNSGGFEFFDDGLDAYLSALVGVVLFINTLC